MGTYRLHRGYREPNGLVTEHVTSVRPITARSPAAAMAAALADGTFLITEDANLAWLTDTQGKLVSSLRLDEPEAAFNG